MSTSPIRRLIAIGQWVVDRVLAGAPCPVCGCRPGDHTRGCLAGEAILEDPVLREQARATKDGRHG